MLENDYTSRFGQLVESLDWEIELPRDWLDYFDERGEVPSFNDDDRNNQRLKIRTYGLMWFDKLLPFCVRTPEPFGIYSRDFSRTGVGFLSPFQIYPEEQLRIALPTFWVQLRAVRARRITSKCYEIGAELLQRHDPSGQAFEEPSWATSPA